MSDTVQKAPAGPGKSFATEAWETVTTVIGGLAIALVLRVLVFQPFTIPSDSMEPGLLTGDYVVVTKWDYGWSRYSIPLGLPLFRGRLLDQRPQRGDVVVFHLPRDPHEVLIKRVIGLPGDRVQVRGGRVLVNGAPIGRTAAGETEDPGQPGLRVERYDERTARGGTYVTFDQGPGHDGDDTGVYRVPEGAYFMMGDNRDNSLDSRWPEAVGVGFVPAENLVGRARLVAWSWRPSASLWKPWTWLSLRGSRFLRGIR